MVHAVHHRASPFYDSYAGLARQPKTFDPVKLNTQHYKTIAKLNKSHKKNPRLNKIFARRVPWRWQFSLTNLVKPIPSADRPDLRTEGWCKHNRPAHADVVHSVCGSVQGHAREVVACRALFLLTRARTDDVIAFEGPVRQKYKGNPNNPKPFFEPIGYGVRTFTHVSIILACTYLLFNGRRLHRGDATGAGLLGLILLSCIGE